MTNSATLINQDSGDPEWYTPAYIIESARRVMGGIDLDPASCDTANITVSATRYYTQADDGLTQTWAGRVWMNHPYGDEELPCRPNCKKIRCQAKLSAADKKHRGHCIDRYNPGNRGWINKLVASYQSGSVTQAVCICFASTSEQWFQPLFDYPICFLSSRVKFIDGQGGGRTANTKGSVVAYLGPYGDRFAREFSQHGRIMVAYQIPDTQCAICKSGFQPRRSDALYCSAACKQRAIRQRAK